MHKAEARAEVRRRLARVTAEQRAAWGEEIAARIWDIPEIRSANSILLYSSLRTEVPTRGIAERARELGIRTTYPRCLVETMEMTLHHVRGESDLETGAYGILEPYGSCEIVHLEEVDIAILPGLAWDTHGNRLGKGAGYYDRLMDREEWRAKGWGIFFEIQSMEDVPVDPWDRKLDGIVTEARTLRIDTGAQSQGV